MKLPYTTITNNIVIKQTKRHKTDGGNDRNINVSNIDNKKRDN